MSRTPQVSSSGNMSDLYTDGHWFLSQFAHWLSWLSFFWFCLSPCRQMLG